MLTGVYRYGGGPADELPIARELPEGSTGAEGRGARGPLAVFCDGPGDRADVGGVTCTLDGRLHDREELARELGMEGVGDAELIARGYPRHGEELLRRLRGRFSFALWNESRRRGVLGCDLLATRPVFMWRGSGYLAFAGELSTLLSMLPVSPGPSDTDFVAWLGGWTVPVDRTLFEGVSRLAPGRLIELDGGAHVRTYWRPRYSGTAKGSRGELAEGLREQIDRSVARRLSKGSSGVILSGGLDSSIVTAVASCVKPSRATLGTYSAVFPGAEYDEGWKVRSLTGSLGIDPSLFQIEPQGALWRNLDHVKRWGLPLIGSGGLVDMEVVSAASRDGVDVVLDGQTGDEVFGFSPWLVADRLRRGRVLSALGLARRWPGRTRPPDAGGQRLILKYWGLKGAAPYAVNRYVQSRRDPEAFAPPWLLPASRSQYTDRSDEWSWKEKGPGPRWWRYLADILVEAPHRELRLDYLRNRAGSAGVESETPLYDPDLVEYSLRLPPEMAFDPVTRPLARESVRGLIPDDVRLNNTKAVFSPFCFEMLTQADAAGLERLLLAPDAELGAYVDLEKVRRLWREERPGDLERFGTMQWGTVVWRLAAAESWLRWQSDPAFIDEMLASSDVPEPRIHALDQARI